MNIFILIFSSLCLSVQCSYNCDNHLRIEREDGKTMMLYTDDDEDVVYHDCKKFTCVKRSNDGEFGQEQEWSSYEWIETLALYVPHKIYTIKH